MENKLTKVFELDALIATLRKAVAGNSNSTNLFDFFKNAVTIVSKHDGVLIGGLVASLFTRPRATEDVDFSIVSKNITALIKELIASGFVEKDQLEYLKPHRKILKFTKDNRELDLILYTDNAFADHIKNNSSKHQIFGASTLVPSVTDFVILKIASNRTKDYLDIQSIEDKEKINVDEVKKWLTHFGIFDRYAKFERAMSDEEI